jgi:hypothetical protein
MPNIFHSVPVLGSMLLFLLAYSFGIVMLFQAGKRGLRRRWVGLDYVWVPLGALTGIFLIALCWQACGSLRP